MKATLKWIKDYIQLSVPLDTLVEKLTMAGLEVSSVKTIGDWKNVFIGTVKSIDPHPNADRLRLVTVEIGGMKETVVCGAPNVEVGRKIAFAKVGAELIDGHTGKKSVLKPVRIRGVESAGMICSEKELGISDNHEGILILPDEAPEGADLSSYLGDAIFDIEITPNRPDCLSVIGIVREIAAQFNYSVNIPEIKYEESDKPVESYISIEVKEPSLCPRYCAAVVTDLKVGPSPLWMQQRLLACGMRPINNVVDITNYVMLEYGQPLHAFDYKKVSTGKIIVRRAFTEEVLTTLDGVTRTLNNDVLVIADEKNALALAGIMGGQSSEITESTDTVLVESANFNQAVIHKGSTYLKVTSEAASRFEKGLSKELALIALHRALQLLQEFADGKVAKGIIDVYSDRQPPTIIDFSIYEVDRLLGINIKKNNITSILERLGFEIIAVYDNVLKIKVPWWRTDVRCEADVVEEIARIIGYESIPVSMLKSSLPTGGSPGIIAFRNRIRDILVGCGLQEVMTYSVTNIKMHEKLEPDGIYKGPEPLSLLNPMSKELECLRTDLRVGLLQALARNQRFQQKNIKIFEIGKIFLPKSGTLPDEKELVGGIVNSDLEKNFWYEVDQQVDFYSAKGIIDTLLGRLRINGIFKNIQLSGYVDGSVAEILADGQRIGLIGEVHPKVLGNFEISGRTFYFELDVEKLLILATKKWSFKPLPKYPGITRDLAIIIDEDITYYNLAVLIEKSKYVDRVMLFDIYKGKQIGAGKKSLAFRIFYQAQDHTLTDEEVDAVEKDILQKLNKAYGAVLRA